MRVNLTGLSLISISFVTLTLFAIQERKSCFLYHGHLETLPKLFYLKTGLDLSICRSVFSFLRSLTYKVFFDLA